MKTEKQPNRDVRCFICAGEFPDDEVIELKGYHACARCKTELVQLISEGVNLADRTAARDGKVLVMGRQAELPKRCIKCNDEPAPYWLTRQLSYHSPVIFLTLLVGGPLLYLLCALATRRQAKVKVPICAHHRVRRGYHFMWAWGTAVLSGLCFWVGWDRGGDWPFALSAISFCAFLGFAIYLSRVVVPVGIDKEYVRLRGIHPAYLRMLPDWNALGK